MSQNLPTRILVILNENRKRDYNMFKKQFKEFDDYNFTDWDKDENEILLVAYSNMIEPVFYVKVDGRMEME